MKLNLAPQQSFLLSLISISLFVGIFQITQIEDKLNNYNISNNLSSYLPFGKNIQLNIEEFKLSIFSHQNNTIVASQNVDEIIQNTQTNNISEQLAKCDVIGANGLKANQDKGSHKLFT